MGMTYKQLIHRIVRSLRRNNSNDVADQLEKGTLKLRMNESIFIHADATNDELANLIDRGQIWLESK